ncbi:MAG: helix-turn-helix transcriptional regulator [Synergistaceae bacterium]|nr:helix-turn-helix transcriptional regulator [Synergistaceae bacterium]
MKESDRMAQSIGLNIRARRRALGLNQEDLAGKLGLTQANISRIEASPRGPSGEMLVALARALDCDVHCLLGVESASGEPGQGIDEDVRTFVLNAMRADPQFGMCLRDFVRDPVPLAEKDWKFLASSLKLALGYAGDAIRAGRQKG